MCEEGVGMYVCMRGVRYLLCTTRSAAVPTLTTLLG